MFNHIITINIINHGQDLTLRLLLAQRYELGESPLPTGQLEAADEAYRSLGCWLGMAQQALKYP
jgi:hypothetical protein